MIHLSKIFIYPIKSTAPVEVDSVSVEAEGLRHDRRYVVTDDKGRFLTARQHPQLLLIQCEMMGDAIKINAPDFSSLTLTPTEFEEKYDPISIWRDTVSAQRCGKQADDWLSKFLGIKARLYFMGRDSHRPTNEGGVVSFADGAPLLLLSEATVDDLNTRLEKPVSMRNFRPNLVVSGAAAYAEDDWPDFQIGNVGFRSLRRCARCILTTIDPITAVPDAQRQPLATLMKYRRGDDGQTYFGRNIAAGNGGIIQSGQHLVFNDDQSG